MATTDTRRGTNIFADIFNWCGDLPAWQKDALRRIVENGVIADSDVAELTLLCKRSAGLELDGAVPEFRPLRTEHVPKGTPTGQTVTLRSISRVENVNVLDGDQHLEFGASGLTIIFGYNASGKSGYGRILRRACRARNKGPAIMPNVMASGESGPATAEIVYALDGDEQAPEQWVDDQRSVDPLGAISFFDSECAVTHVRERIDIAFTPFGLDVLPKLGAACKEVQSRLDAERKRLESTRPKFLLSPIANTPTAVGMLLSSLRAETDVERIEQLASLNDAETGKLKSLPAQLANDPTKQAEELRNRARRIVALQNTLEGSLTALSDDAIDRLKALAADHDLKAKAAEAAAQVSFSKDPLPEIGEDAWRRLWDAARRYSVIAYPGREFPVIEGDDPRCVLCQQPLDDEAKDRLQRFEQFVTNETAKDAASARQAIDTAIGKLDALGLREQGIREQVADLKLIDLVMCGRVRGALAALLRRFRAVTQSHSSGKWDGMDLPTLDSVIDLRTLADGLNAQANGLEENADEAGRKRLQAELDELKAREWLATVLGDVKEHITRIGEIQKLNECIAATRTNAITAKSKALAKEHVTDRLRDAFASEIRRMHQGIRRLNVELAATAGEYGSTYYRVQIVGASKATIESIVSEGEHQCIALAGFLSELATEECHSAIVFDDPVTSLDHNWRECFARRLVEEAASRQVIVFTHDIVFLHDLMTGAEREGVSIELRRLQTNRDYCGVVSDGLPWIAQKTLQRIDELEKQTRATQADYDANNDDEYELGICRVYDGLRATVERAVEEYVFRGIVVRHRDYINLKDLRLVSAVTLNDCERLQTLFQRCCDITQAHDRATLRSFGIPRPDEALSDLADLRSIVDDIRAQQKTIT